MKKFLTSFKKAWLLVATVALVSVFSSTAFAAHTAVVLADDGEAITIAAGTNNVITVDDEGGDCAEFHDVTLTAGTYTPTEMAVHLSTQLSATFTGTATATYNYETRVFSITSDSAGADSLCWSHANSTAGTALGYTDATDDLDVQATTAVAITALTGPGGNTKINRDRIYATSAVGSNSTLLELEITPTSAAHIVISAVLDPPSGWTIRGWNLYNTDDAADAADATDDPDMDNNVADSIGCADPDTTTGSGIACAGTMPAAGETLTVSFQSPIATTQTLILQVWVDAPTTAGVDSADWTLTTTDDGAGTVATTFRLAAADADDVAFEIYDDGGTLGDISSASTGSVYIYDHNGSGMAAPSDLSNTKATLAGGMAVFQNTTNFTGSSADTPGFDYAVTGADESLIGDDQAYTYTATTIVRSLRAADTTDPTITDADTNVSGGKNTAIFTFDEPLIYDTLTIDPNRSITSTSTIGDTTSTSTGLVFAGIGEWTDTDGQPNTTNATGCNTVSLDDTLTILTVTMNGSTGSGTYCYFTNTAASVAAAGTGDDFTPVALLTDAAANVLDIGAVGTGDVNYPGTWDVTAEATTLGFEKTGINTSTNPATDEFRWSAMAGSAAFDAYWLYYGTATITAATGSTVWGDNDDSDLTTVTTTTTDVTSGPTAGTTYFYRLGALDTYGNLSLSTELSSTNGSAGGYNDVTGPNPASGLAASVNADLEVVLTWVDPTDSDLDGVQVYKSEDGNTFFWIGTVDDGIQTYTDDQAEAGQTYYYRVLGVDNISNLGSVSSTVEVIAEAGTTAVTEDAEDPAVEDEEEAAEGEGEGEAAEGEGEGEAAEGEEGGAPAVTEAVVFDDAEGHWAETEIEAMVKLGVVKGKTAEAFSPDTYLNRAEATALLYRVLGLEEPPMAPEAKPFSDVATDAWYAGYVDNLKYLGLVQGQKPDVFAPAGEINKAEFLQMAMNVYYYLEGTEMDPEQAVTAALADLDADAWYAQTVSAAYDLGFVSGETCTAGKCYNPGNSIRRAEATKILYNMFYELLAG